MAKHLGSAMLVRFADPCLMCNTAIDYLIEASKRRNVVINEYKMKFGAEIFIHILIQKDVILEILQLVKSLKIHCIYRDHTLQRI